MEDPLPGRLLAAPHGLQPSAEWQQAARSRLTELVRQAHRPALENGVPDAPQVVFHDDAEILACFARDVVRDTAAMRWWWRHLVASAKRPSMPPAQVLAAAFMERAAAAPAAIALLLEWGMAGSVLETFEPAHIYAILCAIAQAFQAPPPPAAQTAGWMALLAAVVQPVTAVDTRTAATAMPGATLGRSAIANPRLAPEARLLLAVCQLLHRTPQFSRAGEFWNRAAFLTLRTDAAADEIAEASPLASAISESPRPPAVRTRHTTERHPSSGAISERSGYEFHDAPVATEVAGVFFLVNALRPMGIFRRLPPEASPWTLLEFCGKCLLGGRYPAFAFDPLWRLLRQLAGLEPGLPVADIDVPRAPRHGRRRRMSAIAMGEIPHGWRRFLGAELPALHLRLARSLETADLSDSLLLRNGDVYATRTHVDVMMNLRQVTIAVRRAGLDTNPGWVPLLGRILTFHYRGGAA